MRIVRAGHVVRALVGAALAATTLSAVGTGPASAAVACQRTFTSGATAEITPMVVWASPGGDMPVVAEGSGQSVLEVPAGGTIADLDVTVHITHPFADHLALSIQQTGGATVVLKARGGSAGANFTGTTFDDEATQAVGLGTGPFAGRFRPVEPLSGYDGTAAGGAWKLLATNWEEAPGTIDSWSVTITYATCDFDADGVEDHADRCPGLSGPTASGCPTTARGVAASYRNGRFKGSMASAVPGCRAPATVTIWKVRKGPDLKVGAKATAPDGRFKLKRAKKAGRYYVTSPQVLVPGAAECPAVQSAIFRVR